MRRAAVFLGVLAAVVFGPRHPPKPSRDREGAVGPIAEALCSLTQSLTRSCGIANIFAVIEHSLVVTFGVPVALVLPAPNDHFVRLCSPCFDFDQNDMRAATIALREGQCAGHGTSEVPRARSHFVPLRTSSGVVGALGFKAAEQTTRRLNTGGGLFQGFINQVALAVLRARLEEQAQHAKALQDSDNLQNALLGSISHNVRTPLAAVLGALSTLQEEHGTLTEAVRRELIENARSEAERLNRLLVNLLGMSRLEAGALCVRMDPCDVQDVIGAALEQLGPAASSRPIHVSLAPGLPFVRMDFVLIVQVIVNLLDNALKYSPEHAPITLEALVLEEQLEIRVLDSGDGIPERHLTKIFEKFNRAGRTGETGGIGLGLSICRGLIEAHHGRIWARRREPRGTAFTFALPVDGRKYG